MINMFDALKDAKSYATRANAEKKLAKFAGAIPEEATTFTVQRPSDNRWLAVVIHRNGLTMNIPFLCWNGICVTN